MQTRISTKSLEKSLTDIDGLAMKEVVGEFTRTPVGTTFFQGSKPIDGVWETADITMCTASIMSVGYSIGDHRLLSLTLPLATLLGIRLQRLSVLHPND